MSSKNRFELDPERLATTDEHGNRVYIYPEDVQGKWKDRRFKVYWVLIVVYLVLPWIYLNGKPALMVNIAQREFTVLGFTLHGVEPILFFLLMVTGLFFVAFMTSVYGRVWCGWGCPQTVFIQAIFLKIEAFIEGKARERMELDKAPLSLSKIFKRSLKWGIFAIISLHIAHTFVGYFLGPRELFYMTMQAPSEHMGIFLATMIITAIILLDFGWFREQFCIIACPYGRIQSVMMDDKSKVVAYDYKRGEPRRGGEGVTRENEGDCINCYNCVKVCPTGIDIRRGTQLECIACTQCIDACDSIMTKLKKPTGLIRYSSEQEFQGQQKTSNKRPYVYVFLSAIFFSLFFFFLNASTKPSLVFLRGVGAPFLATKGTLGETIVTNRFTLKIKHQGSEQFPIKLVINDPQLINQITIQASENPILLNKNEKKVFVFFKFDNTVLTTGSRLVKIDVLDLRTNQVVSFKEITLVGPLE